MKHVFNFKGLAGMFKVISKDKSAKIAFYAILATCVIIFSITPIANNLIDKLL